MNCRNSAKYLADAIDSVYSQTYKNWEIIFWDNGSTDESAAIAKKRDSRLRYFKSEVPLKLGGARNLAIAQAQGKYIAFLDCDDKWFPAKLEKQVAVLEAHDDIDFVYSNYFRIIMPKADNLIPGLKGEQPYGDVVGRFLRNYPVNLQTVMLRTDAVNRMDEKFDGTLEISEEFDFFMRLLFNSKAFYIDQPLAVYRIHSNMLSFKLMHQYPVEAEYIINKFKKMDESFEDKYRREIKYYNAKLGYWRAKAAAEIGNMNSARLNLAPYKFVDLKFFFLYLITFLPCPIWKLAHQYKLEGKLR
jgi:glycosyltransferase involved in cell wall biosynthesis